MCTNGSTGRTVSSKAEGEDVESWAWGGEVE